MSDVLTDQQIRDLDIPGWQVRDAKLHTRYLTGDFASGYDSSTQSGRPQSQRIITQIWTCAMAASTSHW